MSFIFIVRAAAEKKGEIIFNHITQNWCFVVLAVAVKQPLDSQ